MYICGYIALSNGLNSNREVFFDNSNIWGHFWAECGYLTPGVPVYRDVAQYFAINFEEIPSCLVLNVYLII